MCFKIYLFFGQSMRDLCSPTMDLSIPLALGAWLVPCPGIKFQPFCIGGLSHWTTRKVPLLDISHYVSGSSNKRREKGKRRADSLHIFVPRAPVVREKGFPSQSFQCLTSHRCRHRAAVATATLVSRGAGGERGKKEGTSSHCQSPFLRPAAEGSKGSLSAHTRCAV